MSGSKPFNLEKYLKDRKQIIDYALKDFFCPSPMTPRVIAAAVRYSLFAGGKRIRPILCLASWDAIGSGEGYGPVLPVACALEMIHTYSLVHDDLPAMDNDDFRRGKPTCHRVFGEDMAILAGDALQAEAFALLSREETGQMIDSAVRLQVINIIAQASGASGLAGGQALDLKSSKDDMDLSLLEKMHGLKTGALIVASLQVGALLAGGNEEQMAALTLYGRNIGLAFQIVDDLLDVEGDDACLGKSVGGDADKGKATYPALLGLEESRSKAAKLMEDAARAVSIFGERTVPLRELARFIIERKY